LTTQRFFIGLALICVGFVIVSISQGIYNAGGVVPSWIELTYLTPLFNFATSYNFGLTLVGALFILVAIVVFVSGSSTKGGQAD
jgi:cytochrome c oxidase assembly factor CtaG